METKLTQKNIYFWTWACIKDLSCSSVNFAHNFCVPHLNLSSQTFTF